MPSHRPLRNNTDIFGSDVRVKYTAKLQKPPAFAVGDRVRLRAGSKAIGTIRKLDPRIGWYIVQWDSGASLEAEGKRLEAYVESPSETTVEVSSEPNVRDDQTNPSAPRFRSKGEMREFVRQKVAGGKSVA